MPTLLIQIAPQRSTQYSELASQLAPIEIQLSPLGKQITSIEPVELGGQSFHKCQIDTEPDENLLQELGRLAMSNASFTYYDQIGDQQGPFLRPLDTQYPTFFPKDLITTRRYQGKTNELFTQFMCNIARYSSDFANKPWTDLRLFDPLAGGGTTLFVGMVYGAETAGVEQNKKSAQTTSVFIKQYMKQQNIRCILKEERLKKINAYRWIYSFGRDQSIRCFLGKGEIDQSVQLISGFKKPHMIVADLPYGIQHKGALNDLLSEALPIWNNLLLPGGTLVYSWDSTRFTREKMVDLVKNVSPFQVLEGGLYDNMGHRVDRVIKNRDVIVARA